MSKKINVNAPNLHIQETLQAAALGEIEFLRQVNDNNLEKYRCISGCTALHWAAGNNQLEVIRYLILDRKMDVNICATKKAKGRTPLHYACRNGCLLAVKLLVDLRASVDARAKSGVSPFQLAVWQNHLEICKFLVYEQGIDPAQLNDFDCGAVHWIGLSPFQAADGPLQQGELLIPMAKWLSKLPRIDFTLRQRQGHSPFHKAAWGGHIALLRWLRDEYGIQDDTPDFAGNYAADLAEMANDERHAAVANWIRRECSPARALSCRILGVDTDATKEMIRKAFFAKAKELHPDKCNNERSIEVFERVRRAYIHLVEEDGIGKQSNAAHSLKLMIELCNNSATSEKELSDFFRPRLIAVLLEYGDDGLNLSNLPKKWNQVWPSIPCPWEQYDSNTRQAKRKGIMMSYLKEYASDIIDFVATSDSTKQILLVLKDDLKSRIKATKVEY
jgi:Ankyrin repeats (3 copies)/DnaJ domain